MKMELWWIGKTIGNYLTEGILDYSQRIKKYVPFRIVELLAKKNKNIVNLKNNEGAYILEKLNDQDYVILLDEKGLAKNSQQFAEIIDKLMYVSNKKIIFIIGGAYGFSDALYARAQKKISLSFMTFPHDLVRLIFVEQLYRAFTINHHLPYHHA